MKDIFNKDITVGDVGLHFYPVGGRAIAKKVRVTGFTPKRIRYVEIEDETVTRSAIPEQFAILTAASLDIVA